VPVKLHVRWSPIVIGISALVVGLLRLELGNQAALTEVLWAEDGLFPLCVRAHDPISCTFEPFAGYLLFVPRLGAILLATLPISLWPFGAAFLTMVITGLLSGAIYSALKSFGLSMFGSSAAALAYVLLPITGLEVIAGVGSLNAPLLIASAVLVVAVPRPSCWPPAVPILLLVTALTIPTAVVLAPFIALNWMWRRIESKVAVIWLAALSIGLLAQATVVLLAVDRRDMDLSITSMGNWVRGLLDSVLSLVPGLSLGDVSLTPFTVLRPFPYLAWLLVGLLAITSVLGVIHGRNSPRKSIAAQLVLLALPISLIPSLSGTFSFRYFVAPVTLLVIALLVLIDKRLERLSHLKVTVGSVLLALLWMTSFPASGLRSSPAPAWSAELDRVSAECQAGQVTWVEITLTPAWPPEGAELTELNQPRLRCISLTG